MICCLHLDSKYGGGNPVCVRPTPEWQKGIGGFLVAKTSEGEENTPPSAVTVDVHIHTGPTECATSARYIYIVSAQTYTSHCKQFTLVS